MLADRSEPGKGNRARLTGIFAALLIVGGHSAASAAVSVPRVFSDHMVLQRGDATPIWGKAAPGERVSVRIADVERAVRTDEKGRWKADLPLKSLPTGPHVLTVEASNRIEIKDVLIGEVWLCAGQSNMAFSLKESKGGDVAVKDATTSGVREFRVGGVASAVPREDCGGGWQLAGPSSAGSFSAVAYYFAREIAKVTGEPVGVLHASVGGTPVEAWTSDASVETFPEVAASAKVLREDWQVRYPEACAAYLAKLQELEKNGRGDLRPEPAPEYLIGDTESWTDVRLPGPLSSAGLPDSGVVWLRKTIDVPVETQDSSYRAVDLALPGGTYEVFWNGVKLGGVDDRISLLNFGGAMRRHVIPPSAVHKGSNELAVRMYHPGERLGIYGDAGRLSFSYRDGSKENRLPLSGQWKAKMEQVLPPLTDDAKRALDPIPGAPPNGSQVASALFNGFIHPIVPYGLRGVIWYQGENNVVRAHQYRTSFPLLIRDWREQWQNPNLPFYFCQLPNYGPKSSTPGNSKWAELREAQEGALKQPHTGMAVLIDVGEAADIHPSDKQPVGERLAELALRDTYGKKIAASGPVFDRAIPEEGQVRLTFLHAEGGLKVADVPKEYIKKNIPREVAPLVRNSPQSEVEGIAIRGATGDWQWADARIEGSELVVDTRKVAPPVSVRYAWADNPTCNLTNSTGIPAAPFRTDDLPGITISQKY